MTVIYLKPSQTEILRAKKEFSIGSIKYNEAYEKAGQVMRAVAGIFEPVSGVLAMSGGAVAYVAFNKLFMINHFRLLMLYPVVFPKNYKVVLMLLVNPIGKDKISQLTETFVGGKSFEAIYTKETANTWLVRPRVYVWVTGVWTITRMTAKIFFAVFAVNSWVSPKGGLFGKTVASGW